MKLIIMIILFIIGILFGNLFDKIGRKLPANRKIFDREKCYNCGYQFPFSERIPLISYFINSGRCSMCNNRLDSLEMINELFTGLLFTLSYVVFGFSIDFYIAIGIVAILMIVIVSDLTYYIIPDEVLVFFDIYFITILLFKVGLIDTFMYILSGFGLILLMYLIMMIANKTFNKDTLGGGDIKLMFTIGLLLGPLVGMFSLFLSSFIALPVSLIVMKVKKENIIPFGPFLLLSLLVMYFMKIDQNTIFNLLLF